MVAIALMAGAGSAWADSPTVVPTPSSPPTRQALYDGAQTAYDAGDWNKAIDGFTQVLTGMKSTSRSTGVIRGRLARALLLRGRLDLAQAAASQAIVEIRQAGAGPDPDLAEAYLTLGDALRYKLDLDPAVAAYGQAIVLATGPTAPTLTMSANIGVILSDMVTHPDVAARTAEALIADQAAFKALPESDRAQLLTLRARAELNRGDLDKALTYTVKALALSGYIHSGRVSLGQVTVRADAGLISAARHDEAGMHEYFAYAGAGHINEDWIFGASTDLPVCGPDISPDDTAVVEFSIGDDGRTVGAAPIYASRPGQMGVTFARAVRAWRWRQESVAKLDAFWRASIRIQLRCMTTPPAIELYEPFADATRAWLRASGVEPHLGEAESAASSLASPASNSDMAQVGEAFRRLTSQYSSSDVRAEARENLKLLLDKLGAPPEVRAYALMRSLPIGQRGLRSGADSDRARMLAAGATRLDAMPGGQRSAAWLRTEQAITLEYGGAFAEARPPLDRVVALPPSSLPGDDPIRRVAILHLSLLDHVAGHDDAARARLTAAGLTGDQCSLLDVRPVPQATKVSGTIFPAEAMHWRFEGWVREAFDIGADGAVTGVRTVMAYPPYVFGPATEKAVGRFRYLPPTIGDKVLGCAGHTISFHYRMPN